MLKVLRSEIAGAVSRHCDLAPHREAVLEALGREGFALHPESRCRSGLLALQVYRALCDDNAEIAERLAISPRTVEAHVGNIISKLGAQTRTETVRIAVEKRIIK
jgi:hypothetical protein